MITAKFLLFSTSSTLRDSWREQLKARDLAMHFCLTSAPATPSSIWLVSRLWGICRWGGFVVKDGKHWLRSWFRTSPAFLNHQQKWRTSQRLQLPWNPSTADNNLQHHYPSDASPFTKFNFEIISTRSPTNRFTCVETFYANSAVRTLCIIFVLFGLENWFKWHDRTKQRNWNWHRRSWGKKRFSRAGLKPHQSQMGIELFLEIESIYLPSRGIDNFRGWALSVERV